MKDGIIKNIMETLDQNIQIKKPRWINSTERAKRLSELAKKSPRNGKRGMSKARLTKEEAFRVVQERIIERSLKLTNAQTMLGLGTIKVFRIDAHYEYFGKIKKLVKEKPVLVKSDEEIIKVLDNEYSNGEDPNYDDGDRATFYFVETKDANNQAIDSQLNRVFGKALDKLDITSGGNKIAPVIVGMRIIDNSIKQLPSSEGKIIDISKNDDLKGSETV